MIEESLVHFHFGELPARERDGCERHLVACRECLESFLELKRTVESAAASTEAPRAGAKERIRKAVFGGRARPPLRRALVAAAPLAAMALLFFLHSGPTPAPEPPAHVTPAAAVDTARDAAANLNFL